MKTKTAARCQNVRSFVGKTSKLWAHPRAPKHGFTLVELLVVIAVLAMLVAVRVPALCRVNLKSQALVCMSNQRQLTAAWTSWSQDNGDQLLAARVWVGGDVSYPGGGGSGTPTNPDDFVDMGANGTIGRNLPASPLFIYLGKKATLFKCPADYRAAIYPRKGVFSICRSYSMNAYIGTDSTGRSLWDQNVFGYNKLSNLRRPGPANTFVFLDEGSSINDGFFATNMDTYDPKNWPALRWVDIPAAYHNLAGSFSFADGHCEIHTWTDPRTPLARLGDSAPNNLDLDWLQSKCSAKITNPTR